MLRLAFVFFLIGKLFSGDLRAQQTPRSIPHEGFPPTLWFLEYLPPDYKSSAGPFPVLIFLHGSGEDGDGSSASLEKVKSWGPPSHIQNGHDMCFTIDDKRECFIVISPQINSAESLWPSYLRTLIDHIVENYKADPDRIYLTGLSNGGRGVYDFASSVFYNRPNRLAAIVPISALFNNPVNACLISYRQIPVWAFHGKEDTVVPYAQGLLAFNSVKQCMDPVPVSEMIFTTYEEDGKYHNAWIPAYDTSHKYHSPNVYEWLLRQRRVDGPVAIESEKHSQPALVYPNPARDQIYLTEAILSKPVAELSILDMAGREVRTIRAVQGKVDISNLHGGVYIISLKYASGISKTIRLIKL